MNSIHAYIAGNMNRIALHINYMNPVVVHIELNMNSNRVHINLIMLHIADINPAVTHIAFNMNSSPVHIVILSHMVV